MPATIRPPGLSHGVTPADSAFHSASRRCSGIDSTSASWSVGSAAAISARSSLISGWVVDTRELWRTRPDRSPRGRGDRAAGQTTPGTAHAVVEHVARADHDARRRRRAADDRAVRADLRAGARRSRRGRSSRAPITASSSTTARLTVAPGSMRTRSPSTTCGPTTAPCAIATPSPRTAGRAVPVDVAALADARAVRVEPLAHAGAHAPGEDVRGALQVALGRPDVHPVGAVVRRSRRARAPTSFGQTSRSIETLRPGAIRSSTLRSSTYAPALIRFGVDLLGPRLLEEPATRCRRRSRTSPYARRVLDRARARACRARRPPRVRRSARARSRSVRTSPLRIRKRSPRPPSCSSANRTAPAVPRGSGSST